MMIRKLMATFRAPSLPEPSAIDESIGWTGLLAALVGCIGPLVQGLSSGWPAERFVSYGLVALVYLALTQSRYLPFTTCEWHWPWLGLYLLVSGIVCLALITISGDPFIQPIAFTVPLVYASQGYPARRMSWIVAFYLGLMALGLWLSGERHPEALLFPVAGYGAFMAFAYVLIRLLVEQTAARQRADTLSRAMAEQRDYLARLVTITAALTRDLDITTVLETMAEEGRVLARADQVRVWLRAEETGYHGEPGVRLAAAAPPQTVPQHLSADEQPSLLAAEPQVSASRLVLPLIFKGESIGALELHGRTGTPFAAADARMLQPFADAAAVALENARLFDQARVSATLTERNRLARELHDTIAQGLTAVTMQLEAAQRVFERDLTRARGRIGRAHELARETLEDVRRSVWTLASPLIDGHTLNAALEELTQRFAARTGISAAYRHSGPSITLDHAAATQVLRIAQEALQNVEKHARATRVSVGSETTAQGVRVWVRDNGVGFDPDQPAQNGGANGGFGLTSLRERARLAGGMLQVESQPGAGTDVTVSIPGAR